MSRRNVALVVILLIGAVAWLAWHLGVYSLKDPEERRNDVPGKSMAVSSGSPEADAVPARQEASNRRASESAAEMPAEPSKVGLPFELSRSVQANCERWPDDCDEMERFLERMAAEPRDVAWAPAMEARIEKAVISGERGKFRIRALECRRERCALEVASEVDHIGLSFDSDPEFNAVMIARPGYFADENDPQTGIVTLVTVQIWQTMDSFRAEEVRSE